MWLQSCCGVKEDTMSIHGFQAASESSTYTHSSHRRALRLSPPSKSETCHKVSMLTFVTQAWISTC